MNILGKVLGSLFIGAMISIILDRFVKLHKNHSTEYAEWIAKGQE